MTRFCRRELNHIARAMRPDLMAVDKSRIAADAELTRVLEPGMPGVVGRRGTDLGRLRARSRYRNVHQVRFPDGGTGPGLGPGPGDDLSRAASVSAVTGRTVGVALGTASVRVVEKLHGRSRRRAVIDLEQSARAIRGWIDTPRTET